MAFPLAHPTAIMPLRRFKRLSFPALVVNAVVPDLGYVFFQLNDFSHQPLESIMFGLAVEALILMALWDPRPCGDADAQSSTTINLCPSANARWAPYGSPYSHY